MQQRSEPLIAVCIPTLGRNALLRRCLAAVQELECPDRFHIACLVADNDAGAPARGVAEAPADERYPVHYFVEARRGFATVRNRLLEEALRLDAAWIAFIDDDETPAPGWLREHMRVISEHGAAVSTGPVVQGAPGDDAARSAAVRGRRTGAEPRHVACNNTVFAARLAAGQGLRFDPRFDRIGGEDFEFFERSSRNGNRHVWAAEAPVYEPVAPERAGARYLFRRHFTGAINAVVRYRKLRGAARSWPHFLLKSLGKLLGAAGALLGALLLRRRALLDDAVKRSASACGYLCGLVHIHVER